MRHTTCLRQLIEGPELLVMPGCYDVISGKVIEAAGFKAAQASGANIVACHLGVADYSVASMTEMALYTGRIAVALGIPVMGDADTGFGNAVNAYLTVRAFERAGIAGMNIEDQLLPKRCGHLDGKEILPIEDAVAKIRAAADARTDPDFVINARTDALSVAGYDETVRRANAYLQAGANMAFVEGAHSRDVIARLVQDVRGPLAVNLVEGGKSPQDMTFKELQEMGVARVSLPSTAMQSAIGGMQAVLRQVMEQGGIGGYGDKLCGFGVAQRMVGFGEILELERKYLATAPAPAGG